MKEKALELEGCFMSYLGGFNLTSTDRSSIFAARTEYRFKKQFKILVKPRDFVLKHYISYAYEN